MNEKKLMIQSDHTLYLLFIHAIGSSFSVDDRVLFHEDPLIARWDEQSTNWKLDGISETKYDTGNTTSAYSGAC